jgi:hypothetical protein
MGKDLQLMSADDRSGLGAGRGKAKSHLKQRIHIKLRRLSVTGDYSALTSLFPVPYEEGHRANTAVNSYVTDDEGE